MDLSDAEIEQKIAEHVRYGHDCDLKRYALCQVARYATALQQARRERDAAQGRAVLGFQGGRMVVEAGVCRFIDMNGDIWLLTAMGDPDLPITIQLEHRRVAAEGDDGK